MFGWRQTKRFRSRSRSKAPFKRRKRTIFRRRRKATSFSGQTSGSRRQLGFTARRLSRRSWKSSLYRSTRHLPHYRSQDATTITPTSSATASIMKVQFTPALFNDFWESSMLQPLDSGATTDPLFTGDLVIRGGKMGLSLYNDESSSVKIFVWLVKIRKGLTPTFSTADKDLGWDPTLQPDFRSDYGTVIFSAQKIIQPQDTWVLERRIPVMKIDRTEHTQNKTYQWFVGINGQTGSAVDISGVVYYNLSFTGDATVQSG